MDLTPSTKIIEYIKKINIIQHKIEIIAKKLQGSVNFKAKPFKDDYGNSTHFHVNFINSNSTIDDTSLINKAAQSICHYMLDTFLIFMPCNKDYLRLDKNFMTPTNRVSHLVIIIEL